MEQHKNMTKEAKQVIRAEIRKYYGSKSNNGIDAMRKDAERSWSGHREKNNWKKGKALVDDGCFACYHVDQAKMLSKIYGKKQVNEWDEKTIHNLYGNLIGREYAAMLNEKNSRGK